MDEFIDETTASEPEAAAGAEPTDAGAAAEAEPTGSEATAPTATPGVSFDSPEFRQAVANATAAQIQAMLMEAQQAEQEPQLPQLDPFDESYPQQLAQVVDAIVAARVAPFQPVVQQMQERTGQERLGQVVETLKGELGEFDPELAENLAHGYLPQTIQQYGPTPQAAEQALRQAAQTLVTTLKSVREQAVEEYKQQLAGINGRQAEPGVAGGATRTEPAAKSYDEIIARMQSRERLAA